MYGAPRISTREVLRPLHSLSFDPAVAIEKLLRGAKRSLMQFLRALFDAETNSELFVQRFFVVAHDVETAALGRAFRPEGADDDVASGPNCGSHLPNVGRALFRQRQEVKHCAVVPHVISVWRKVNARDISDEPRNLLCGRA